MFSSSSFLKQPMRQLPGMFSSHHLMAGPHLGHLLVGLAGPALEWEEGQGSALVEGLELVTGLVTGLVMEEALEEQDCCNRHCSDTQ